MKRISFDFDKNFISVGEPLGGIGEEELLKMANEVTDAKELAWLFAGVFNQGEHLLYLEEWECKTNEQQIAMHERYLKNREIELLLLEKILIKMGYDSPDREDPPIGYYHVVTPFMKKNGFIAKNRVFVKKKLTRL